MSEIAGSSSSGGRRRRQGSGLGWGSIEILESRALLADGITPAPGPPLRAVAGIPVTNAVFATFRVTDPFAQPGMNWRALINFGDGQSDGPVVPVPQGDGFQFVDSHTYRMPGTYTATIMIAVPGSHKPNNNTVTTPVTVTSPAGSPTPTPNPPTPLPPPLLAAGLRARVRARENRPFHGPVANIREADARARNFGALIDWGDLSPPTPGRIRIRAPGRYVVIGSHHFGVPGIYRLTIAIRDGMGQQVVAEGQVRVVAR